MTDFNKRNSMQSSYMSIVSIYDFLWLGMSDLTKANTMNDALTIICKQMIIYQI